MSTEQPKQSKPDSIWRPVQQISFGFPVSVGSNVFQTLKTTVDQKLAVRYTVEHAPSLRCFRVLFKSGAEESALLVPETNVRSWEPGQ